MKKQDEPDPHFESLLDYIKQSRGFDFCGYKRSSLMRRFLKRMQELNLASFEQYQDYLEVHPDEFAQLFESILINVTSFFRDDSAWQNLAEVVIPVISKKNNGTPLRIWSAGCASGEEPCSIAILLAEELGIDEFDQRVKIYATDVDEQALASARLCTYSAEAVESVPEALREKYFVKQGGEKFALRNELRRAIIFGRHDLVQDAPISHLDLLICRNTLMYLNAETQSKIINRFHFALNDTGFLFLGKAEMLISHVNLFSQADLKQRVFAKIPRQARESTENGFESEPLTAKGSRAWEVSIHTAPFAQMVVESGGTLIFANDRARKLFSLLPSDIGRPFSDLEVSYRPADLRSLIDRAKNDKHTVKLTEIERQQPDEVSRFYDIQVTPLFGNGNNILGTVIFFVDVTNEHRLQVELQRAVRELEESNEELQSASEELETTNEELQSTNEELETTNEELQSTNEELETMNEELQSSNEELETLNDELKQLSSELTVSNVFLRAIVSSLDASVIVLNEHYSVLVWNNGSEDMWGLRQNEVIGQNFFALDIGLPVSKLKDEIIAFSKDGAETEAIPIEARNRRGKDIKCDVKMTTLHRNSNQEVKGVVLVISEMSLERSSV